MCSMHVCVHRCHHVCVLTFACVRPCLCVCLHVSQVVLCVDYRFQANPRLLLSGDFPCGKHTKHSKKRWRREADLNATLSPILPPTQDPSHLLNLSNNTEDSQEDYSSLTRIVGGQECPDGECPWQVTVGAGLWASVRVLSHSRPHAVLTSSSSSSSACPPPASVPTLPAAPNSSQGQSGQASTLRSNSFPG